MGWGIGIGIGWPMASSSSNSNLGYFSIISSCKGNIIDNWTSQLIDTSIYSEGDYVDGIPPSGGYDRYILGVIQQTPGIEIAELYGPPFTKCFD
jgi:hypothetical protein